MERQSGGIRLRDENGLAYGIKQISNKPRISSVPYLYDIAEGNVPGHEVIGGFGARDDVQVVTGGSDLWSGVAAVAPLPPDVGERMSLVSTSDEDGAGTLTGILSVSIHYLDAAGVTQNETVALAGTTPVHTTAVNIRFVQSVHALTTGSTYQSVGRITLYKFGSAATVYQAIEIGGTVTLSAKRVVMQKLSLQRTGRLMQSVGT